MIFVAWLNLSDIYIDSVVNLFYEWLFITRLLSSYYPPALFDTIVNFEDPFAKRAAISFSGIPHNPKPPTSNLAPSGISATVSSMFW